MASKSKQDVGVEHVRGNLYRVKHDLIQFADVEFDPDSTKLSFKNPRRTLVKGKVQGRGFSKEEMAELREAIRQQGLNDPLQLRKTEDGTLQLIEGERRKRCIDKLITDKAECYNTETGKLETAVNVFEFIECRVHDQLDDMEAYRIAFTGNATGIDIGDGATVALVKQLRNCGENDKDILACTGKSITWLRDTDTLVQLDEVTFDALATDEINRSAALELAKVADVEERLARFERSQQIAEERNAAFQSKAEADLEKAEMDQEIAEATVMDAELTGSEKAKTRAKKKVSTARSKAVKKQEAATAAESRPPVVGTKDVRSAAEAEGDAERAIVKLTMAKINKFWNEPCMEMSRSGGKLKNKEGESILQEGIDFNDAKLVIMLCRSIDTGKRDIVAILKQHNRNKSRKPKK